MPHKLKSKSCSCDDDYPLACSASVEGNYLHVCLRDGRSFRIHLSTFPSLFLAPEPARSHIRIVRPGIGLRWPDLGYELGVGGLVNLVSKH